MKIWRLLAVLCGVFLLAACSPNYNKMALTYGQAQIPPQDHHLVLMSLVTKNTLHSNYQPDAKILTITPKGKDAQQYKLLPGFQAFGHDHDTFLMVLALPKGQYTLNQITGDATGPLIDGNFTVPLNLHFVVTNAPASYLGQVNAVLVKKMQSDQASGGDLFPLLDQAVTGFHSGTFVVSVHDNYDTDIKTFKSFFPALRPVQIDKSIMQIQKTK